MPFSDISPTDPIVIPTADRSDLPNQTQPDFKEALAKLQPWLIDQTLPVWVDLPRLKRMIEAADATRAGRPWRHGTTVEYWDADCYLHRLDGPASSCGRLHKYYIHWIEIDLAENGINVRYDGSLATPADHVIMARLYDEICELSRDDLNVARGQSVLACYLYGDD